MNVATSRTLVWPVRLTRIGLGVLLLVPATVLASTDICQSPDESSHLSFGYYQQDWNELDGGAGSIRRTDQNSELHYEMNDRLSLGIAHRYVILDVAPQQLQTNGHLHTVTFPLHRQSGPDGKSFRLSIAPALSASSNVMKDPGEYGGDTFQLLAAVSGYAAYPLLARENGLHLFEVPEAEKTFHNFKALVVIFPQPEKPAGSDLREWQAQARSLLAEAKKQSPPIVRRYREEPSPLVRDSIRHWRTGRIEKVFGGDFDLFE